MTLILDNNVINIDIKIVMKRKLFQILLMGAVTVSLGMFVSCKDTNEELYNQLKIQVDANAPLYELKADHLKDVTELQRQLDSLKNVLPDPCTCDTSLMKQVAQFMQDLDALTTADGQPLSNNLQGLIDYFTTYTNNYVTNYYTTYVGVTRDQLDAATDSIANLLRSELSGGGNCSCDLARIDSIEKMAIRAFNLAQDAINRIQKVDSIAKAAATSAAAAADSAREAANIAKAAGDSAASALALARQLDKIANAANKLANANKDSINIINQNINNIYNKFQFVSDSLQNVYKYADSIWVMADANRQFIEKLDSTVKADSAIIVGLKNKTHALEGRVDTLYDKVDSLGTEIENLKPEITKLYTYADANLEKAKAYTDTEIALLRADLNGIDVDLEALRKEFKDSIFNIREDLNEYVDSVKDALQSIAELKGAVTTINDSLGKLDSRIDENTLKIGEVDQKLDSIAEDMKDSIAALRTDLSDLEKRVKKNEDDIKELVGDIQILQENLKRMVTGIIVQGTYNPAFGTINVPIGIQSNVLIAYYGNAYKEVYFPTARTANYVDETKALTSEDIKILGIEDKPLYAEGDVIMQDESQNAGTLYLTVNPNTVDFSKLQLSLVNTQDKESFIKLGELKRSDKTLQLGFSRSADNGFYEAPAYLTKENVNKVQKINFNTASIKDAISEIVNKKTSADPKKIASDLADVIKGLRIDATAVKCEWEDAAKEGATPQKHAVYSNYNLAATAVKPLSLQTLKDANYKTVPGYERVMNLLDSISAQLHNGVHTVFKELNGSDLVNHVANLTIKNIEIADLTEDQLAKFRVAIDTTIVVGGLSYHLDLSETVNVPVKFTQDVNVPINIQKDVEIDLSKVTVKTPTIVVTTDIKNKNGTASLLVPVKDNDDKVIGNAVVDLNDIDVKADASIDGGTITLDGKAVAKLDIKQNQKVTINVDQTVSTTINIEKWVQLGDYKKVGDNYVYVGAGQGDCKLIRIWVTKDLSDAAESLWGTAQSALGSVNGMLSDLRQIVSDANAMIAKINSYEDKIDTKIDDYMDKVTSYVNKINNKLVGFVNSINTRLQPVLIASDGKGAKVLSEAKNYPTEMTGDINFVPTTWNLELLVPIAKKHVAVTDVINGEKSAKGGDGTCLAELKRVNGSPTLNVVLSGEKRRAYATGMKSGYIYEVAYSALDFHGIMSTRKYYIRIK